MNPDPLERRSPTPAHSREPRGRKLRIPWFGLARVGAGLVILLTIILFVAFLPRSSRLAWEWDTVIMARAFGGLFSRRFWALYLVSLQYIVAGVSILTGILVYTKRVLPQDSRDWAGLAAALTLVTGLLLPNEPQALAIYPLPTAGEFLAYELYTWMTVLGFYFLLVFVLIFPDGKFTPRWMRWIAIVISLLLPISMIISIIAKDGGWVWLIPGVSYPPALLLALGGQVYRYRVVSSPTERQQTKWVVYSLVFFLGVMAVTLLINLTSWFSVLSTALASFVSINMQFVFALMVPVSVGISILKYRLWDIDLIIRRTLVYSLLSSTLILFYFFTVVVLQEAFRGFMGETPSFAIVISTLGIAALFNPLRRRVQDFIDRRFYRKKYDADRILKSFAVIARDEVDVERLTAALLRAVEETMHPVHSSTWLKGTAIQKIDTKVGKKENLS